MADFEPALAFTLKAEGGFSNRASDRGGPTNYGITQKTLSAHLGREATVEDVRGMSMDTVRRIYRAGYWDVVRGGQVIKQGVATTLFDFSVNTGPLQAVRFAQRAVGVVVDGNIGPKTLAAINAFDAEALVVQMSLLACRFYVGLVIKDPTQHENADGWVVRAYRCVVQYSAISMDADLVKV